MRTHTPPASPRSAPCALGMGPHLAGRRAKAQLSGLTEEGHGEEEAPRVPGAPPQPTPTPGHFAAHLHGLSQFVAVHSLRLPALSPLQTHVRGAEDSDMSIITTCRVTHVGPLGAACHPPGAMARGQMLEGRWLTPAAHGGGARPFLLSHPRCGQPQPWRRTRTPAHSVGAGHPCGAAQPLCSPHGSQAGRGGRSLALRSGLTRAVALPACPLLPMKQKRPRPGSS